MQNLKCPKCDDEMHSGLLVDAAPGGAKKGMWVKGEDLPKLKVHLLPPGLEVVGECYRLTMYRCVACGFVETYATDET